MWKEEGGKNASSLLCQRDLCGSVCAADWKDASDTAGCYSAIITTIHQYRQQTAVVLAEYSSAHFINPTVYHACWFNFFLIVFFKSSQYDNSFVCATLYGLFYILSAVGIGVGRQATEQFHCNPVGAHPRSAKVKGDVRRLLHRCGGSAGVSERPCGRTGHLPRVGPVPEDGVAV